MKLNSFIISNVKDLLSNAIIIPYLIFFQYSPILDICCSDFEF